MTHVSKAAHEQIHLELAASALLSAVEALLDECSRHIDPNSLKTADGTRELHVCRILDAKAAVAKAKGKK